VAAEARPESLSQSRPVSWPAIGRATYCLVDRLLNTSVNVALHEISLKTVSFVGPMGLPPGRKLLLEMTSPKRSLPLMVEVEVRSCTEAGDRGWRVTCAWTKPINLDDMLVFV
jgi:hypothetical protein